MQTSLDLEAELYSKFCRPNKYITFYKPNSSCQCNIFAALKKIFADSKE